MQIVSRIETFWESYALYRLTDFTKLDKIWLRFDGLWRKSQIQEN